MSNKKNRNVRTVTDGRGNIYYPLWYHYQFWLADQKHEKAMERKKRREIRKAKRHNRKR